MKLRPVLCLSSMLLSLVVLSACSRSAAPPAEAPAPAPATAPAAEPAAAPASPAAEAAPAAAPEAAAPLPIPVAGTDYTVIPDGQPFDHSSGKIEVLEYFNYICPGCAAFNPILQEWKQKHLPADAHMVYVPADFRPDFVQYAQAFYAADSFGLVDKTHDAVYVAIHEQHKIPGEGDPVDDAKIAAYYSQFGIGAEMFLGAMRSFAVETKIKQGREFAMHAQLASTPSLVVAGKYVVKADKPIDKLHIVDYLIAKERADLSGQPMAAK